jgi:cutinase
MSARQIAPFFGAAVMTTLALLCPAISIPSVAAAPCPDVEVVYARATGEPTGLGSGQAFVDALRSQVGGRSVSGYAVNYPASDDFAQSTPAGARDMVAGR